MLNLGKDADNGLPLSGHCSGFVQDSRVKDRDQRYRTGLQAKPVEAGQNLEKTDISEPVRGAMRTCRHARRCGCHSETVACGF